MSNICERMICPMNLDRKINCAIWRMLILQDNEEEELSA